MPFLKKKKEAGVPEDDTAQTTGAR